MRMNFLAKYHFRTSQIINHNYMLTNVESLVFFLFVITMQVVSAVNL
jgi:choline kinase